MRMLFCKYFLLIYWLCFLLFLSYWSFDWIKKKRICVCVFTIGSVSTYYESRRIKCYYQINCQQMHSLYSCMQNTYTVHITSLTDDGISGLFGTIGTFRQAAVYPIVTGPSSRQKCLSTWKLTVSLSLVHLFGVSFD